MEQALFIAVRFYDGRYHGVGDWPPAPARLFQALMSGGACGAKVAATKEEALDWLEKLQNPVIAVPRHVLGQAYVNYVPNNDLDTKLASKGMANIEKSLAECRIDKHIRPILFDAETPILYYWVFSSGGEKAREICSMTNSLYQLGRGIDMAWATGNVITTSEAEDRLANYRGEVHRPSNKGQSSLVLLCPQDGTRKSLTTHFERTRTRFQLKESDRRKSKYIFVQPPKVLMTQTAYDARPNRLIFELKKENIPISFSAWPLRSAVKLVETVRDKVANCLVTSEPTLTNNIELYLLGQNAREEHKAARVRIVPIPSIGHQHADMAIRRLAVYVPQSCPLEARDIAWAFSQVVWKDSDGVISEGLHQADDEIMVKRFERRGRCWRSVTPLVLTGAHHRQTNVKHQTNEPRNATNRINRDACAVVAVYQALRHAGIRTPVTGVHVQREPFDAQGVRAESFALGSRFTKDTLWHAAITFAEPVKGPILLGDGRFLGLGLMQLDGPTHDVVAFSITEGIADKANSVSVAHAARRAMLARVQKYLKYGESMPLYVSGHKPDGAPAGDGFHRHIAVVADLPRSRLLYIPPTRFRRHGVHWNNIAKDHYQVVRALEGMDILRAGKSGLLKLSAKVLDLENDPLFSPSRIWESVTSYDITRYSRRLNDEDALKKDVILELERCGWPQIFPDAIEILSLRKGPRGALSGHLRLHFQSVQNGPLLIGRTAHKGGGLFSSL